MPREKKGDITINISEIFRNPDSQNEVIKAFKSKQAKI